MTKQDFQHVGKVHHSLSLDQHPDKILERKEQLVTAAPHGQHNGEGGNWQQVERPALKCADQSKSTRMDTPWHALAAVECLDRSKERPGPVVRSCGRVSDLVVEKGSGKGQ